MNSLKTTSFLVGCGVALGTIANVAPAHAFTFTTAGQAVTVNFNGNVNQTNIPGLTSQATFTFQGFSAGNTQATFNISLTNTSSGGITSRVSALGFNTSTALTGASSSGLFTNAVTNNASFPNQFGALNVCFTNGNTCQGGQGGGVTNYAPGNSGAVQGTGNFIATLNLASPVSSLTLSNFGVRYQSISGNGLNGASGTGSGTPVVPPVDPPSRDVPEPGMVGALALLGLAAARFRKRTPAVRSAS